jgi:hypothetical protein
MDKDGSKLLKHSGEDQQAAVTLGVTIDAYMWWKGLSDQERQDMAKLEVLANCQVKTLGEQINERYAYRKFGAWMAGQTGTMIILYYGFQDRQLREWRKPFYMTAGARMIFKYGPGLFDGMKPARVGQYEYHKHDLYAVMQTTPERYHKDRSHFLTCVLRHVKQLHIESMQKFVGGAYSKK